MFRGCLCCAPSDWLVCLATFIIIHPSSNHKSPVGLRGLSYLPPGGRQGHISIHFDPKIFIHHNFTTKAIFEHFPFGVYFVKTISIIIIRTVIHTRNNNEGMGLNRVNSKRMSTLGVMLEAKNKLQIFCSENESQLQKL